MIDRLYYNFKMDLIEVILYLIILLGAIVYNIGEYYRNEINEDLDENADLDDRT